MAANPKRILRESCRWSARLTLAFGLYACSFVPAQFLVRGMARCGLVEYDRANQAFNTFYAPVWSLYEHVPIITQVGDAVDSKTRPLLP